MAHDQTVAGNSQVLLDHQQLRDLTMGDEELMYDVMQVLIEDTERQAPLLEDAIRRHDAPELLRLADYCKGACDGVGARSSAELLRQIHLQARLGDFAACHHVLGNLTDEIDKLRREAGVMVPPHGSPAAAPGSHPDKVAPHA